MPGGVGGSFGRLATPSLPSPVIHTSNSPRNARLRPPPKLRGSETECVNAFVGADIQAVLRRYQRLKVMEPTQCFAGHDRLSGIAAERVEPIVAFSAKDPYNRIGMSIRRGGDSGTAAA